MPFKKGREKTGGKVKGTKNKDTEFKAAIKEGVPVELVLQEIQDIEIPKDRVAAYLRLLEFAYPKMKALEVSGEITDGRPEVIEVIVRKPNGV